MEVLSLLVRVRPAPAVWLCRRRKRHHLFRDLLRRFRKRRAAGSELDWPRNRIDDRRLLSNDELPWELNGHERQLLSKAWLGFTVNSPTSDRTRPRALRWRSRGVNGVAPVGQLLGPNASTRSTGRGAGCSESLRASSALWPHQEPRCQFGFHQLRRCGCYGLPSLAYLHRSCAPSVRYDDGVPSTAVRHLSRITCFGGY